MKILTVSFRAPIQIGAYQYVQIEATASVEGSPEDTLFKLKEWAASEV